MKDSATTIGAVPLDGVIESHLPEVVVVHTPLGECLSYLTLDGVFEGSPAQSIAVIEDDSDYQDLINRDDTEVLALPTDKQLRREILAKWAKKAAKKNKVGLIPVMLLPLAACNTSTSTTEVTQSYNITEDAASPGTWVVTPADAGAITITQAGGNYKFTPTTGDAIDVAVAGVNDFSLSAGTYTADVAALANVANAAGTEPVSGAGNVALTKLEDDLDADLSVITTTGTKTVAISGAQGVKSFTGDLGSGFTTSIGAGSTLSTTATILDGQTISGAGTVVVSGDLSNDLSVDLSAVTATGGITATETAGGTFIAGSDLGAATVTINAAGETVDLQAAGAGGVDASTFIVNAGTLVVTHAQMDAISNVGTITGSAGNVTVIAGSDTATGVSALLGDGNTQSSTALVKVDMSGTGTLTFDLPSDDNDTLVLEAGSVIKFGAGGGAGGTVVVDHGEVDARNVDAANWTNVGTVRVNSGINITAKQLEKVLTGVETSGSGRINVEIEEEADIALVKTLMTDTTGKFKGATKPAVTLEASSDATDAATLENQIIAEAPAIAKVAKIAIPVKTMAGGIKYSSPSLDIRAFSDSGVSDADNVSQAVKPLMKIILPNANLALENDDTITVKVETLDGTTFTEVSSTAVVLNNTDGDVNKNVEVDANGNSYIYFSGFDASQLDPAVTDGTFYITALADDKSDNAVNDLPSNKVMYVLDTTAPTAEIAIATPNLGAGKTSKVTVTFSEKVVGFDPAADITLSDSSAGSLSAFTSADGGKTWISEFTPAAGLASGSTTISLTNESYTDVAGNVGAGKVSSAIAIDTKAPDAPTVAAVSTDNLLNKAEHDGGFTLTGTCEAKAGATVKVSGFLTGAKDAVVDNGAWTLAVAKADLGADAATMLSITQSDAVGNKSDAVSLKLTTDVTAPTAVLSSVADNVGSVTGALSDGQTTDDTAVIITGTNEAGSTVDVYNGTTKLGAATVSGTNWTYEAALSDGTSYALNAIETDSVGNPSSPTSNFTVIGDTTAPTISGVTTSWGSVLNSIEDNSDGTVTIATSGAEDGQTVTVVLNSKSYTGTVSSNTTSITVSAADLQALSESSTYTLSANVSDAAGNAATQHSSTTFSVDKTAPTAVLSSVADNVGSVTGALSDGQTTDDTAVIITGTNEAGSTVDVYNGTTKLGAATVSGTNWTYEAALSDGTSYALNAIETDSVGNPSSPTSNFTVIGDTTAPTISGVTTSWGSVLNSIEDNSDGTVTIATSGAEDGQTVTVVLNSKSYTGTVSSNTTSITVSAADLQALSESSTYTLSANVSDAAGNAATQHSSTTFSVDKTAPTISGVTTSWGSVLNSIEDNSDGTVTIATSGAEDGQTVTVVLNSKSYTGTVSSNTTSITVSAADLQALSESSTYTLSANVSDAAGNAATQHSSTTFSVDKTAPTAVLSSVADNVGSVTGALSDGQTTDDTAVIITGTNEAGSTVDVYNGTTKLGAATVSGTNWTYEAALSDGTSYALNAIETDSVGNPSSPTSNFTVIGDTTAPTISGVTTSWGSVLNSIEDNSDGTVTIATSGAEDGQTVTVVLNSKSYTGTVSSNTTSITVSAADLQALSESSTYTLSANVSDAAGNAATQHSSTTFSVDKTAPTISGVTTSWGSVLNSIEDNSDGTVTIATSGAEDGQTVTVVLNSKSYTGTVSSNTTSITVSAADLQALSESSTYTLSANVSDAAGNAATQHSSTTFSVDKTAPGKPANAVSVAAASDGIISASEKSSGVSVSIDLTNTSAATGDTVELLINGASFTSPVTYVLQSTDVENGSVSITINSSSGWGNDGTKELSARVIDVAGNVGVASDALSVVLEASPPNILTVTSGTTDGTYNIGDVVAVNVKFDEVVTVTGTPQLTLETGDVDRAVDYVSGSGSDTLLFNYTVQSGDVSGDLAYGGVSALALNSGTILDNATNAAILTLPAVGGTGSLSNSSALVIDGVRPAFTGGAVTAGTKTLVLSLGEAVSGTPDAGDFAVTVNSASNAVTAVAVASNGLSITLTLTNFVQNNNDVTAAYTANSDAGKLLKDAAGNTVSSNSSISVTRSNDTNSPDVLTVTSSTTDGTYNIGDVVAVNVKFDEVVTVTGTPQLTLETGDVDRAVDYVSGSGSDTLLFNYTVQSGDVSGDLAYGGVSALALNSGTILDNASNAATLTLPAVGGTGSLSNSSALVIDGVRPAFTGGAVTAGTKTLVLNLGEAVSGTPDAGDFAVTVNSASNAVTAVAVASNGLSITLTLTNFVQNNNDVTAAYTANSDAGKLLKDAAGNTVSSNSSISVTRSNDTNSPDVLTVTSSTTDGTYNIGDVVAVNVKFDEVVTVTGTPQLTLETGDVDRAVDYVSGSGSDTLLFNYTVQSGDVSGDLAYGGVSALALNSGTILDNASNAATLTLPAVGGTGSLSNSSALVIDGVRPAFTGGAVTAGTKTLVLSLGEAVSGTPDAGDFAVTVNSASNAVTAVAVASNGLSITLTLTNFVQNNNDVTAAYTANSDAGKLLKDAAGNTVSSNSSISVTRSNDTNSPDVLTVTSSTTDGTYNIGDVVAVNVKFDEVVTVTGTPQLTLETGDVDRAVDYVSGSGSDTLLFNYTVQSGDVSGDLAYGGVSALALNSGTILDNASNAATLTLPAVGGTGSLSNSSALVIDGVRPAFTGGAVTAGTKTLVLSLGEAVSGTPDAGDFAVTVNSASNAVTAVAVASNGLSITLTLTNFVQNNNDVTAAYTANSDAGKLLKDAAGNTVSSNSSISVTRSNDTNSPDVLTVTSSTTDGTYNIGDVVAVNVKFDEVVTVTGTPQLTLETGDVDRAVDYVSGSGSDTLLFNYTVQSGDVSGDLAYGGVSALALNSGTILDNASNAATLTLPAVGGTGSLSNSSALVIDGVRPAFTGGAVTAGTKTLVLSLGEAVSGTPDAGDFAVTVNSASNAVTAVAVASNGLSITLTLTNFVQNNNDVTAAYTANSDAGKLLKDAAGNTVSSNSSISVTRSNDTNSPDVLTVTSSTTDGTYNIGDVVAVNVKFDEVVTVTGTPQLTLETGDVDRVVDYVSGSGSDTLLFNYTVQSGDVSGDLAYGGVSALALNSGTILDNASNAATLTLPAVGGTGSLSNSSALVIDGVRPAFTGGAVTAGTKTLVLSLGEAVSGTPDAGDFAVTVNSASNAVTAVAVASNGLSITLTLTNFVQNDSNVTASYTANSDTSKLLTDAAGNTVSSNSSITVVRSNDDVRPTVLTVTSSTTDGSYDADDLISIAFEMSEVVTVTGTPQLTLETGDVDRVVDYVSGSGSDTLLFNYTVQSGDASGDLDYTSSSALSFNDGIIEDIAGNILILTLPEPGTSGSLSDSSQLQIIG